MAAAGYDVSLGDTWAVNEFSSAVRQGTDTARADARNFVHGLFDGDGTLPTARGTVFIVGIGQGTTYLSVYKTNLENWLQDTAFWTDMNTYVSDWSQEVYGDFRNYGVAGSSLPTRRDYLNDYLEHEVVLADAGPATIAIARSFLRAAYSPLANAAWQYSSGFGYTLLPFDQMENYVSAQTYALRYFSGTSGQSQDHWGFPWAPNNASGLSSTDFTTQTGAILDRLAAAIHDSAQPLDPSDPGIGACGPLGQNQWCGGQIDGAWFNDAWKTFQYWSTPTLSFATAPQTLTAGSPSAAMTVQLQTSATSAVTVNLSSSSAQGAFSTSAGGPWTSTLSVTIPAGSTTSGSFYYEDTKAGSPTLTASATGANSGTQTETVKPGPLASVTVSPSSASIALGGTQSFTANGADAYGNPIAIASASANWSVSTGTPGTVSPTSGNPTTFTASSTTTGSGSVIATVGTASGSAAVTVVAPAAVHVSSIAYATQKQSLLVTVALLDGNGKPVAGASVSISLARNASAYRSATGTTGADGKVTFKVGNAPSGCYTTTVTNVTATGYTWDGVTPTNQFCK